MSAPALLQQVESNGRRFVLRRCSQGMFPFEVSEQTSDGHFIDHHSYRLQSLAEMDLERRVVLARRKPVSEMTFAEVVADLREKYGALERHLSAADQYRAENPMSPSCMPDHHS